MTSEQDPNVAKHGWTAVPRDPEFLFKDHPTASGPTPQQADYPLSEIAFPTSALVERSKAFVKKELNEPTYNHSHRVFIYGALMFRASCC